jgi:hypothetical protein
VRLWIAGSAAAKHSPPTTAPKDDDVRWHGRIKDCRVFQGQEHPHHRLNWLSWKAYVSTFSCPDLLINFIMIDDRVETFYSVVVEKVLRVQPDANKIYLLVRGTDAASAQQRVQQEVQFVPCMHASYISLLIVTIIS